MVVSNKEEDILEKLDNLENRLIGNEGLVLVGMVNEVVQGVLKNGKKEYSEKVFFDLLKEIKKSELIQKGADKVVDIPLMLVNDSIKNICPILGLKNKRRGKNSYVIPIGIIESKQGGISIRWLVNISKKDKSKYLQSYFSILLNRFQDSGKGQGSLIDKREEMYKDALKNIAYLKFL